MCASSYPAARLRPRPLRDASPSSRPTPSCPMRDAVDASPHPTCSIAPGRASSRFQDRWRERSSWQSLRAMNEKKCRSSRRGARTSYTRSACAALTYCAGDSSTWQSTPYAHRTTDVGGAPPLSLGRTRKLGRQVHFPPALRGRHRIQALGAVAVACELETYEQPFCTPSGSRCCPGPSTAHPQ